MNTRYDEDSEKELDEITGCTEHKEIGSSSDGKYKYYHICGKKPIEGEVQTILHFKFSHIIL